jgi:hypothetical protein
VAATNGILRDCGLSFHCRFFGSHVHIADICSDLLAEWGQPVSRLPDIVDLAQYLNGPLSDEQKIPVSEDFLAQFTPSFMDPEALSRADAEALFRSTEHETADFITTIVKVILMFPNPEDGGTENSYHSFWDQNIRYPLTYVLNARAIRDGNKITSAALPMPDFGLLVNGICVFRGEEKVPSYSGKHPRRELFDKLTWTYDPAPYVLGMMLYL